MAVVISSDLGKDISGEPLLRGVSFKLERRDRMTLSGRNGAGKTTLLRMLAGQASVDFGELVFAKGAKVSLHDQRPPRDRDLTLREYILSGAPEMIALEEQLAELEQKMADGDYSEPTLSRYSDAQAALERAGGYTWRERALSTLHGLGFRDNEHLDRSVETFSGGELTRASLGRALAGSPDLLLLDEPTNHLDIESLEWLETHLVSLDAAIVLVAHDRWFLEAVGTSVLELEAGRGKFFDGTWHAWRREKATRELALGRAIEKQEAEIAKLERFVTRFRAGTRARQAQSRQKKLDRIDRISRDPKDGAALGFAFKPPERSGRVVFELEHGDVRVGDRILLDEAELWLERGEHVTMVGPNGAGKTTLIETLGGLRPFADAGEGSRDAKGMAIKAQSAGADFAGPIVTGKLKTGHNVKVGFLSQHAEGLNTGNARTVVEACQHQTKLTPGQARALLGRFLFSGEDAEKPIEGLSGGELRRLSLAVLVGHRTHPPNVLILDEPTNHLDLESREALEEALSAFEGSLLLVSHDRALLDAVGQRTISFEDQSLRSYTGGWPEYLRVRDELAAEKAAAKSGSRSEPKPAGRPNGKSNGKAAGSKQPKDANPANANKAPKPKPAKSSNAERKLEQQIEGAEAALQTLEDELAGPEAWSTPARTADSTKRHEKAKADVEALYEQLERIAG